MSDEQNAIREEAVSIATMVVAGLSTNPETKYVERVDRMTGQSAHANKITLVLNTGEQYTFSVSPVRTRAKGDTKSKK